MALDPLDFFQDSLFKAVLPKVQKIQFRASYVFFVLVYLNSDLLVECLKQHIAQQ